MKRYVSLSVVLGVEFRYKPVNKSKGLIKTMVNGRIFMFRKYEKFYLAALNTLNLGQTIHVYGLSNTATKITLESLKHEGF